MIDPDPSTPDQDNNTAKNKNITPISDINPDNIPRELKEIPQWILWGYIYKDGKIEKVPIDPKTGAWISAHDPKNWLTFEEAIKYSKELKLGIGFDFTENLGYVFIDLDHVYKNGIIEDPRIKSIMENADTFIEISPSGEGFHLFFKCPKFDFGSTRIEGLPIEIYDKARFSTFTGMPFGELKPIREIEPEDLKKLLAMKSEEKTVNVIEDSEISLDDSQRKDLTDLLEEHWDQNKPEADGNHHQHTETTAVYMKEAGVPKLEGQDFMIEFDVTHPCADGKIHPINDIKQIFDYVYDRNYSKTAPAGSVSKEFKRRLYRILNRGKAPLDNGLGALNEILALGPNDAYEALISKYKFLDPVSKEKVIGIKTVEDPDSDKEEIYIYTDGFYSRGEARLKEETERFFRSKLEYAEDIIETIESEDLSDRTRETFEKLKAKFEHRKHIGVMTSMVSETLNMIRRNTYVSKETMNPDSHIPLLNGFFSLKTWGLEPHNPSLFYTWRINRNYLERDIDPKKDMPMYIEFLSTLIPVEKILAFLSYQAYAVLHPGFPVHKTLWLVGRQRIGKGASVRLLHLINPEGHGTISIAKMLREGLGFDTSSIVNKNFVTDAEVPNVSKQKKENWAIFNAIFGGDDTDIEAKYKQKYTGRLRVKGIFIQNLPMIKIQNDASVERIILIQTRNEPIKPEDRIPDIEKRIFEKEGDAIVTYFLKILKILSYMNYVFPEKVLLNDEGEIIQWVEMDLDEKYVILENLSDEVDFFIEERTKHPNNGSQYPSGQNINSKDERGKGEFPVDEAYSRFKEWCQEKGIVPLNKQEFTRRFGREFPKKRKRGDKKRTYIFTDVEFIDDQSETEDERKLGQESDDGNLPKNRQLQTIECVSQLMDIKLIRPPQSEERDNKDTATMLGQKKNVLRIRTGLNFQYKGVCPNLFADVSFLPKQEPKKDPELDLKATELFKSLKDKLQFFKDPKEHLVTREPSNVILNLQYDGKLSEDEARSILDNWVQNGLVEIVQNQVVLKNQAQGDQQ